MGFYLVIGSLYILCSLLLLCYGIQCYILTFLFLRARKKKTEGQELVTRKYLDETVPRDHLPTVVTQLPMYNEKTVAVRVIEAAAAMTYPRDRHEIQVLDDSTDETVDMVREVVDKLKSQGHNVNVIRRTTRTGFKAGALQHGLKFTDAECVAIFDADFVPNPDFLLRAVPFFEDRPKLGLVQGRWTHLNRRASMLTRGQAMGIDGHFMVEQAARSWNGLFMNFNGTAGIFRRTAIESSGGWQHDTLTEDMDLSYRMQLADWETEYVPGLEVPAEIPEDINAFKNQQFRWAKGSIQTAIKIIPQLFEKKVPFFKFMQAVLHLTHYAVHPLMLMMAVLTMPVLATIKLSLPPALFAGVIVSMILATSGPSSMYMVSQHLLGNRSWKKIFMIPIMMVIGTGLAVNNGKAVLEALLQIKSPFIRTPKKGLKFVGGYRPMKDLTSLVELAFGVYCMASAYMFMGYTNFIVSPFLILYASGFLFVGLTSIIHFQRPELIDSPLFPAAAAYKH